MDDGHEVAVAWQMNTPISTLCWTAANNFADERGSFVIEKEGLLKLSNLSDAYGVVFHMRQYALSLGKDLNFSVSEVVPSVWEISWQPVDPPHGG